jgi:hypothetical protein
MTCSKAQSLITPFINDELDIKVLEEFISHVRTCKECREELEVYYALLTAMKQLDEDKNLSDDFSLELSEKLERAQERVVHVKLAYYRKKGILVLVILFLAIFFSLEHYFLEKEKVNPVTESEFRLRMTFEEKRFEDIKKELDQRLKERGIPEPGAASPDINPDRDQ